MSVLSCSLFRWHSVRHQDDILTDSFGRGREGGGKHRERDVREVGTWEGGREKREERDIDPMNAHLTILWNHLGEMEVGRTARRFQ